MANIKKLTPIYPYMPVDLQVLDHCIGPHGMEEFHELILKTAFPDPDEAAFAFRFMCRHAVR